MEPIGLTLPCAQSDPLEPVSYVGEGPQGPQYCINMSRMIDMLKLKSLEAVVRDRCAGREAWC